MTLLERFRANVEGKWDPDVCLGNLHRLMGMAREERGKVKKLMDDLEQALEAGDKNSKVIGPMWRRDLAEAKEELETWDNLITRAGKQLGLQG
jgi:hypothetical protein